MNDEPVRSVPKRLADFEIIRRLGVGGMAEVFLAKKRGAEGTFKLLVVKRVLPQFGSSRRFRTMFAEEAQLATRLNHPNIVQVYEFQDYGEEGQLLSMEYVEGPDLRRLMRAAQAKGTRIPPSVAAFIIGEIAKGLHYAHERRDEGGAPLEIVHRDVSPQNVLLSFDGAIKIADFGIASANLFREEPGVLKGKTGYMSPEQARAERVDRRSDVYSLGVVFHELLAGRPLHGVAEGQDLLEAVRLGQVEPPSTYAREVPQELEAIAMRALAKSPADRFQTAREMAMAITRALFQRQQAVDAHAVEVVAAELVGREETSPGVQDLASAALGSDHSVGSEGSEPASAPESSQAQDLDADRTGTARPARYAGDAHGGGREVRHVTVVRLRLHGPDRVFSARGTAASERFLERLRGMLDEMAFKRGARWTWEQGSQAQPTTAQAVVGLTESSSRAALDGIRLAVDVHEAIRGASDDAPENLRVSVGVVRGIASGKRDRAGHLNDHVLQEPANYLAQLLSEGAPSGTTWVAGGLYRLVRREFIWADAPAIEIDAPLERKLPHFVRIFSLVRPLTREERALAAAQAKGDLVGRDLELADMQAAYHQATSPVSERARGCFTCRVISGELGIGKTALVGTFLSEVAGEARVIQAECSPARSDLPFGLVRELVRELCNARDGQTLVDVEATLKDLLGEQARGKSGEDLVSRLAQLLIGNVVAAVDEADVSHNRRAIATGLRRLIARAAGAAPLVIVVDGLGWCDRPSLELLSDLSQRNDELPVLLLLVTRPDERVRPFIEGLVRVELRGLSAENQIRLLETRLGANHGVAQVCADLLPRVGGNPFFLIEMVDALLERGTLELREHSEGGVELVRVERPGEGVSALPSTLEQLIADRLNELPAEEREIVDWLAVAGGPISENDLRALTDADRDDAMIRLCARGICDVRNNSVDVRHPLTRDVAYRSLEPRRRARTHLALGRYLAQTSLAKGLTAAIVARHLGRGGAKVEAAELYLEAARTAQSSYQVQVATRYYRRAVGLLEPDDLRRLPAHEALEALSRTQGWWRERKKHLAALRQLARASKDPRWVTKALLRTARFELDQRLLSRALSSTQKAEQLAHQAGSPVLEVQAQSLMAEVLRDLGDMQGALAACDRALDTGEHGDVPSRLTAEVLRARGTLLRRVGRVQEAIEAHAEAIAVFRHVGARRMEARAKNALAYAMFVVGRYEDAIALALEALRIDLAIGGRLQIAKTLSNIGQCYARLGDIDRGLAYLKRARDAHERYGDQDSRADTLLCMAELLLELGDLSAAGPLVGDAGALNAVSGSAYDSVHERLLRALLARASGDPGSAVMHAFDARQAAEAQAYVAYHFYAMAIEAAARVDIGEQHTGILLATTAIGALEAVQGSEYGLETRAVACAALAQAGSPQTNEMTRRAGEYASRLLNYVRDPHYRTLFMQRRPVRLLLDVQATNTGTEFVVLAAGRGPFDRSGVTAVSETAHPDGEGPGSEPASSDDGPRAS